MTQNQLPGRPPHPDILTPAEWRVAESVRHGLSNPKIGERLGISANAAKFHVANILGKLGFESRAQLRKWAGVRMGSAIQSGEVVMTDAASLGAIGQVSRSVSNIEAAQTWYAEVLGLTHLYTFAKLAFFDSAGLRLCLSENEKLEPESILYFRTQDIHAECKRFEEASAEIISAAHLIHTHDDGTEEWMAFFNDNDGRPLGLMARVNKAAG